MEPPSTERALRRLVADLAKARAEDVLAVLDQLPQQQRAVVEGLLEAYLGKSVATSAPVAANGIDTEGFSTAMIRRLSGAGSRDGRMTEAALEALRACARQTLPDAAARRPEPDRRGRRWTWPFAKGQLEARNL